jgi:streptogramin lyase
MQIHWAFRHWSIALFILTVSWSPAITVGAPFRKGDIFLNNLLPGSIQQYGSDGTLVETYLGPHDYWEGAAITPDGRVATSFRGPLSGFGEQRAGGVYLFQPDGGVTSFSTPQVNLSGDVSVFRDGTIAVSSQWGSTLELYSLSGMHLRSISHSGFAGDRSPFGTAIGPDDTIWCALARFPTIQHFAKEGTHLGSFEAAENIADLVVDHVDGTLWMPGQDGNRVYHYSPQGTLLGSFETLIVPESQRFNGIAMSPQRTLYLVSENSDVIYHYDTSGNLLGQISLATPYHPVVMGVVLVPEPSALTLISWFATVIFSRWKRCDPAVVGGN